MSIFSKKKQDDDFFSFFDSPDIEENVENPDVRENEDIKMTNTLPDIMPSHALTPEEVVSAAPETVTPAKRDAERYDGTSALEALKKRMREVSANDVKVADTSDIKEKVSAVEKPAEKSVNKVSFDIPTRNDSHVTAEDIEKALNQKHTNSSHDDIYERLKKNLSEIPVSSDINSSAKEKTKPDDVASKLISDEASEDLKFPLGENPEIQLDETEYVPSSTPRSHENKESTSKKKTPRKKTLLEKCKPFILDDNGKDNVSSTPPTYKLESVDDILKSKGQKAIEKLSEKYGVSFDNLGKAKKANTNTVIKPITTEDSAKSYVAKPSVERQIFEDTISVHKPVKNVQTNISHIISDIDTKTPEEKIEIEESNPDNTATIKFTPVSDSDSSASRISVSSQTRSIDLTGEFSQLTNEKEEEAEEEIRLEQNEFEEYVPDDEYESQDDVKRLTRKLSIKKRNSFLMTAVSLILTFVLAFMKLPFMSGIILANTQASMIICAVITGIIILSNIKMFKSLSNIVSRKSNSDVTASIASVAVMAYCVCGILVNEITLDINLLLGFILSVRALSCFWKDSYILSNFKQISISTPKRAIRLLSDPAVTFAMAKNAVEGDTLIAAPQRSAHVADYMKYSTFGTFLGGRLPAITLLSIVLSLITGFACATYFDGIIYGFYSAAAMQCFAALPVIFLIDNLPVYAASKKLNKVGAMIAGKTGAEHIEMANAVVFSSEDLFPSGTVTLHQMKILSENSVDDTIIRAASLTDCLDNTLSPIFKKIAGTGNITSFPDSDTVKYEDRMGISGWVDNKLLFIGNRTLMEAHGIAVPDVEVDRKILRKGFFPVYVACEDKACALLVVQYTVRPEIAHELRKVSSLGVTLLINNSDPNLTEEMICDYMGLYEDSVKVMSSAGCHMYKNAVTFAKRCSAPAAYKGNPIGLASIVNCASKIKKSNILLTAFYVIAAIIGAILFAYTSFDGSGTLISSITVLVYGLVCTAISYIIYLMEKP